MSLQLRSVLLSLSPRPSHLALLPRVTPQALFLSHRGFKTSQQLHWSSSTPPFSSYDPITSRTIEEKQEPSEQRDAQEEVEREETEQYGPGDMMMLEEWRVQKGSMGRQFRWLKGGSIGPDHRPSHSASLVLEHKGISKTIGPISGELGETYKTVQQRLAHKANIYLGIARNH